MLHKTAGRNQPSSWYILYSGWTSSHNPGKIYIVRNTWRRSAYRVGPWKVIASHHLHVGLLDEGDPQLTPVAGVGAEQLPVTVHRQEVIDDHLTGNTSYQVPGRTGWSPDRFTRRVHGFHRIRHHSQVHTLTWLKCTQARKKEQKGCPGKFRQHTK